MPLLFVQAIMTSNSTPQSLYQAPWNKNCGNKVWGDRLYGIYGYHSLLASISGSSKSGSRHQNSAQGVIVAVSRVRGQSQRLCLQTQAEAVWKERRTHYHDWAASLQWDLSRMEMLDALLNSVIKDSSPIIYASLGFCGLNLVSLFKYKMQILQTGVWGERCHLWYIWAKQIYSRENI